MASVLNTPLAGTVTAGPHVPAAIEAVVIAAVPLAIGFINAALLTPLYRKQVQQSGA